MVFQVTMSEKEVLQMQEDKKNAALLKAERERLRELARKVLRVMGVQDPEEGVVVLDEDEAIELMEMAAMYAE